MIHFGKRFLRARFLIQAAIAVGFLALGSLQGWAYFQYRAAKQDLARHHPVEGLQRLGTCMRFWPWSSEARRLAARAAREADQLEEADRLLREAQKLNGGSSEEIAFEWALFQASSGNVREVEDYLQRQADQSPQRGPLVWEALAEGYLRTYRSLDAMACLEHWLAGDPENVRALELRGRTFIVGKGVKRGSDDYRRVLELDPTREETRDKFAHALLDLGAYDEALPHLELLAKARPDDPDVAVRLARCLKMMRQPEAARQTLDRVVERHPDHGSALRTLGQFALSDDRPAEAEEWLRRAAAVMPHDYQTQFWLYESLRRQGKPEAEAQLKLAEAAKERNERMGELRSRKLAERPLDPALHLEMGMLLMTSGHTELGERWLQSALSLDPDYRPAHAALADYYTRTGQKDRAELHRSRAERSEKLTK